MLIANSFFCIALNLALLQQPQPLPPPPPPAAGVVAPGANDDIKTGDDLLKALETADANLHTLTADVVWNKTFGAQGDRQTRIGKLFYEDPRKAPKKDGEPAAAPGPRKFAASFDKLILGRRLEEVQKLYIFDGKRLAEKLPAEKKMTISEVSVEGGKDPLKIGEGPMPVPIGQKRDDILARFNVQLVPAEEGIICENEQEEAELKKHVAGSFQIKLTPRPDHKEVAFDEVRLWYRRGTTAGGDPQLLPRMARTVIKRAEGVEDVDVVRLVGVSTNVPISPKSFDTTPEPGWDVIFH